MQIDSKKFSLEASQERNKLLNRNLAFSAGNTHLYQHRHKFLEFICFIKKYANIPSKLRHIATMNSMGNLLLKNEMFCWNDWIFFHLWAAWIMSEDTSILIEKNNYLTMFPLLEKTKDIYQYKEIRCIIMNLEQMREEDFIYPVFNLTDGVIEKDILLDLYLENIYPLILTPNPACVHSILKTPLDFIYHDLIHMNLYVAAKNTQSENLLPSLIQNLKHIKKGNSYSELDKNALYFILHEIPLPITRKTISKDYYSIARDYIEDSLDEAHKIDFKNTSEKFLRNWLFYEILEIVKSSPEQFIQFHRNYNSWLEAYIHNDKKGSESEKLIVQVLSSCKTKNKDAILHFNDIIQYFKMKSIDKKQMKVTFDLEMLGIKDKLFLHLNSKRIDDFLITFNGKKIWNHKSDHVNYGYSIFQDWGTMLFSLGKLSKSAYIDHEFPMMDIKKALLLFLDNFFQRHKLIKIIN